MCSQPHAVMHAACAQAGDKALAGSDQKLSGKSSDDDNDAAAPGKGAKIGAGHVGGGGAVANGAAAAANGGAPDGAGEGAADGAFDRSKFDKLAKRPPAGPAARKGAGRKAAPGKDKPAKGEGKGKPGKVQPPSPCMVPLCGRAYLWSTVMLQSCLPRMLSHYATIWESSARYC